MRAAVTVLGIDQIPVGAAKGSRISGSDYVLCNKIMMEIRDALADSGFGGSDPIDPDMVIEAITSKTGRKKKR